MIIIYIRPVFYDRDLIFNILIFNRGKLAGSVPSTTELYDLRFHSISEFSRHIVVSMRPSRSANRSKIREESKRIGAWYYATNI